MSNQTKRKLYDNGVLIRLKAPGWSGAKSDPRIREIIVNETGASSDAVSGSKLIVPRAGSGREGKVAPEGGGRAVVIEPHRP